MFESSSQGITEIEGFFLVFEKRIFLKFVRIILFFFFPNSLLRSFWNFAILEMKRLEVVL